MRSEDLITGQAEQARHGDILVERLPVDAQPAADQTPILALGVGGVER